MEANQQIIEVMRELNITRAELAKRLNISRAAVTQLLKSNMTISKIVEVCEALGCRLEIKIHSSEVL